MREGFAEYPAFFLSEFWRVTLTVKFGAGRGYIYRSMLMERNFSFYSFAVFSCVVSFVLCNI